MYIPQNQAETNPEVLRSFIATHALGLLQTYVPAEGIASLQASHLPFTLAQRGEQWYLQAHIAAANPQAKALVRATEPLGEALVTFTAPVHGHVSASFYRETKPKEGKVVPTWDYAAVQVYGPIKVFSHAPEAEDETEEFLSYQTKALSDKHEAPVLSLEGKEKKPWSVSEAPEKYLRIKHKAIVGIEIPIERLQGRFKLNQEVPDGDWAGIIRGHLANGHEPLARLTLARGRSEGKPIPQDLEAFAKTVPESVVTASEA